MGQQSSDLADANRANRAGADRLDDLAARRTLTIVEHVRFPPQERVCAILAPPERKWQSARGIDRSHAAIG